MDKLIKKVTDWLIENQIISEQERELNAYGLEIYLGKVLVYGSLLILSIIQKNTIQTIFFMLSFFSLRGHTGGFHAKSRKSCYFMTLIIYFFVGKCYVQLLYNDLFFLLTVVISGYSVYAFAPLNHPDLWLNSNEIKRSKDISRWLLILWVMVVCITRMMKIIPECNSYLTAGIGMDADLLILGKIMRQEVISNE